jgi:hypothetical protein
MPFSVGYYFSFFLSFFLSCCLGLDLFCLLVVGVEGYSCTWSHFNDTHTHTLGWTPLDEWSARCKDLYLIPQNTHKKHTFMPPVGFEPESQERRGCRPTPRNVRAPGSASLRHWLLHIIFDMKIFCSYVVALILGSGGDVFLDLCYSPGFRRSVTLTVRLYTQYFVVERCSILFWFQMYVLEWDGIAQPV